MSDITEHGRQLAADLANAEPGQESVWTAADSRVEACVTFRALARLATQSLADKAALADLQASYDAAVKDLRKIDKIASQEDDPWLSYGFGYRVRHVADLAAKYRVETDPLLIEARKLVAARYEQNLCQSAIEATLRGDDDDEQSVQNCLIALKRGIELAKVQS